jgi:uridylate kinase
MEKKKYSRILLKISGEALEDKEGHQPYDAKFLDTICETVKKITAMGTEVAMVVGGGNIWRGNLAAPLGIDRATGDYMGMLATIMNAMALQSYFEAHGLVTRVMSAIPVNECCEPYIRRKAIRHLEKKRVVIFASGVGSPFFTTDTAAALRAKEINADGIFMGKNGVEGVYSDDPRKNPKAKLLKRITYQEILAQGLKVMDNTAVGLLVDSPIDICVFNMNDPSNAVKILEGKSLGTVISSK